MPTCTLRRHHLLCRSAILLAVLGCISVGATPAVLAASAAASSSSSNVTEWLYQSAQEHRQAGQVDEAIRDLRKVLATDPSHAAAKRALQELEMQQRAQRQETMEQAISQVKRTQASRVAPTGAVRRVPDPRVNGVQWFYVFGKDGNPFYGAYTKEPQRVFVEVPQADGGSVSIRVLDADIRGRYDERDGDWNTSTSFSVFGGSQLLGAQTVGPEAQDGTTLDLGPFALDQGEAQGDQAVFRVEAEGLAGNDNNLFALEIQPASAEAFVLTPAIRLASTTGKRMRFYPEVPAGTTAMTASNYDLDPSGGEAFFGHAEGQLQRINRSPSAGWAHTPIDVPAGETGLRWMYEIRKGTQARANAALQFEDQQGRPLRIYFSPGGAAPAPTPVAVPAPVVTPISTCNTFLFDGSASRDPDNQPLTYQWDFGDGATAEGVRVRHTFAKAGDYDVVLRVNDGTSTDCCGAVTKQALHVNLPPKAALVGPASSCVGGAVTFSAAPSTDSPGDTLVYAWAFGDGTTGEGADVTHTYAVGGAYRVTVTVNDQQGTSCSTDVAATTVRVNTPPVAKANDAITLCTAQPKEPLTAVFNGSASSDPDRDPLTYTWDFGDGATGTGAKLSHTYARGGDYTATLRVDDGSETACSWAATTVPVRLNHAPLARVAPTPLTCPETTVTFDSSGSGDPDGDALTYAWDFGDGVTGTGATPSHAYAEQGHYTVRLTVDDGRGMSCSSASAQSLVPVNAPPLAQMEIQGEAGPVRPSR